MTRLSARSGGCFGLREEVSAPHADGDDDCDHGGDPGVLLVEMQDFVAHEGDCEADESGDDDSDGQTQVASRNGCKGLTADYCGDYGVPGQSS